MRILFNICVLLLSHYSFSQIICQNEKIEIDSLVNEIDINREKFQIMIQEGEIIYSDNRKNGGWGNYILFDETKNISKIKENVAEKDYTTYEFYYSNNKLIFLHFKRKNYNRKKIELSENCSIYIFNNELTFVPTNQTKYCSLNCHYLIEKGKRILVEQNESIKE
ncbi:hypothetical protein [Moheibacter sediminis]|uniref:Uncharacterized protein n=1 Tax=Moheibacter sediminis TaxID=1434700 RepID=A0A1W1ZMY7_9FLAO|nr:hypothetical protein [Moheibacter sediminis]SMC49789.1 hypothetical protein SAMN06296427_103101 [Moheibacter sediminis]